jgi:hypothetical protein
MDTMWLKTGDLEGACGKILETEQAGVVVKRIHRQRRQGNRSKCNSAGKQCEIQSWASELLRPANGFSVLFSPRAWLTNQSDKKRNEYAMERIDCATQLNPSELGETPEAAELRLFYEKAKEAGIYPCDYELYRQSDGRIGLIDFDKFGSWCKISDEIIFPWGLIAKPLYPWS